MIKIKSKVSRDSNVNLNDVSELKNSLIKQGYYNIPEYGLTPYPDRELFDAIKAFQRDHQLKVDGIVNPDGETIWALNNFVEDEPMVRSPTMWCPKCGGPHGGSKGSLCPYCAAK